MADKATIVVDDSKRDTFKKKRETHEVPQAVKDNLKNYNAVKKQIITAFGDEELTVPQLAEKTGLSKSQVLYYVMSLLKFGVVQTVGIDDMDEFYIYKIKN